MSLDGQQRALQAFLLGRSPDGHLARDAHRWSLYRSMVQGRIEDMIVAALPRFAARAGRDALSSLVRRWLLVAPLDSPYIRALPGQFARWLGDEGLSTRDAATAELVAVELAFWDVSFELDDPTESAICDFAFDLAPLLNATARLMRTRFQAHRADSALEEGSPRAVVIFRSPMTHQARWRELTPFGEALLRSIQDRSTRTASEHARSAASSVGRAVDGALVAELSDALTAWISDGLLLGSRAA
jgi:hypothetical protein